MSNSRRLSSLLEMLEKEPQDVFLNYALGLEYLAIPTRTSDTERQFKLVLELDPNYIPAYYQLGQLFTSLQRTSEALDYYKIGLEKAKEQKNNKAINEIGEAIFMLED
jgi:tetratricopeptide (TPR) repeat protein